MDPVVARRRFVLLTGLRWLRVGPVVAVLVVLLQDRGLTLGQVGMAFAAYGLVTALLELPTGGLADTFGARPVLVAAIVLDVLGTLTLLGGLPVPIVIAGTGLLGGGRALASGPLEAWYVGHARADDPAADIRTGLARGGVSEALALGVGALVAGYGGRWLAAPLGVEPLDVAVFVSLLAHALFLAAVWTLAAPRSDLAREGTRADRLRAEARGVPDVVRGALGTVGSHPELRRLVGVSVLAAVPLVVTEVLWQPDVVAMVPGAATRTDLLGLLAAGIFAIAAAGSALAPWYGRRFGDRTGLGVSLGIVLQATAVVGLAAASSLPPFTAAFLVTYLLGGLWFPLHAELVHDRTEDHHRTTVLSALSLGVQGGNVATQATLIPLAAATSRATAWVVAAAVAATGALLVARLRTTAPTRPADGGVAVPETAGASMATLDDAT